MFKLQSLTYTLMKTINRDSDVFQLLSEQILIDNKKTQLTTKQNLIQNKNENKQKQKCILCILKPSTESCECEYQIQNMKQQLKHKQQIKMKLRSSIGKLQLQIVQLQSENTDLLKKLQIAKMDISYLSMQGIKYVRRIMDIETKYQQQQKLIKRIEQLQNKLLTKSQNQKYIEQLQQKLKQKQHIFNQNITQLQNKIKDNQLKLESSQITKQLKSQLIEKQAKINELMNKIQQNNRQFENRLRQQKQQLQLQLYESKLNMQKAKRQSSEKFIKQITERSAQKYRKGVILQQGMTEADILESLIKIQENYKEQTVEESIQRHLLNFIVNYQNTNKMVRPQQMDSAFKVQKKRIKVHINNFNIETKQHTRTSK